MSVSTNFSPRNVTLDYFIERLSPKGHPESGRKRK